MKTIIIGFSKAKSPWMIGSILICWFLNKPFSHTYFKFKEDLYTDWTINQSTGHGINYISQTSFEVNNQPVQEFSLDISDQLYTDLLKECHANAGVSYGYLTNLGIALVRGLNKLGIPINRNPTPLGINCSGWMYYILQEIYGHWTDEDKNLIAPDDVYNYLLGKNGKV